MRSGVLLVDDEPGVAELAATHVERRRDRIAVTIAEGGDRARSRLAAVAERAWRTAGTEAANLTLDDPGDADADPDRLARLFENLFRNAVEHGPTNAESAVDGSIEAGDGVTVTVGGLDEGGFFVADDGPGVPAGERESVLDAGYSTADGGTGLGLSIAAAHGWTVTVAESETGGARFEIRS